ncbi:hypothetical protein [Lachnotalea glycerini]|nr:hypothetical protein [Lachnotalea glycerini]
MRMNMSDMKAILTGNYSSSNKTVKKAGDKAGQQNKVITFKRSFNASRTLAQLANAKTKSQVSAIERTVRASMQSLKKQSGSEEAVRQMKKVLQKTNMKRKALTKEEQLDNNRKIAKSADHAIQEARLTEELNKKRLNRMRREVVDALNAIDIKGKDKEDTLSYQEQSTEQTSSIDVNCDTFEVSTGISENEFGIAIDTLL